MKRSAPDVFPPAKGRKTEKFETSFFLDSIPKKLLENVLRYLSHIPNARRWETYVDVRNLVEALGFRGGFSTLLKSRFHTLVVSSTKSCYLETKDLEWKELNGRYLWTDDIAVAHAFVVAGGGEALHTLVISRNMYKRGRDGYNLVDDFRKHCPKVTSLSIAEEGDTVWAKTLGRNLEILEVCAGLHLNISLHAPALRELNMSGYYGNSDILRRIGGSLERLVLPEFDDVDKIKLYCPNLKSVSLKGSRFFDGPGITRLLASYGDRLEYALLYKLNNDEIRDVSHACPNARFHVSGDYQFGLSLSNLNYIGPRLEGVDLCFEFALGMDRDLAEWTNAWSQCVNLRHLNFTPSTVEDVQAVFSTPKPHLDSIVLKIGFSFEREDVKKVMSHLANGTKCVKKLEYLGPACSIDELHVFVAKNRATLCLIELAGTFSDGNKKLGELLKSFLQLPALEELYVDIDVPQDILKCLRNNGVYFSRERV